MSLLTICQDAATACNIQQPATIISNTNKDAELLFWLAKRTGKDLLDDFEWQVLLTEGSITGDGVATTFSLPSDLHRIVTDTTWSRSENRQAFIPVSSKEWAFLKGWEIVTTLNRRARIVGDQIEFYQVVPNTTEIHFEYVSDKIWDIAATGTPKAVPTLDNDVFRLDEEIVSLGIIWRYKKLKERAWKADFAEYVKKKEHMQGQEKTASTINAGSRQFRSRWGRVKDSGYGT